MSLPRLAIVTAALAGLLTLGVGTASAHVAVSSSDATPGGEGKVTFRVPDESDTASTVKLQIQLPAKTPLASVAVLPVPGWTFTTTKEKLAKPVTTDDGATLTDRVSVVEFDAVRGGGIAPGEFQEFSLSVGPIPKVDSLTFSAVQTYSDGKQVAWIEPTVAGAPEPAHPAPVLTLTGASAAAPTAAASAADHTAHATTASSSGAATWIALVALLVGLVGVVLGWDARRRTVAS
ncbi:MAG TPA: YcnI family protein [Blastococcus sp.]|nr:YcnI family protein [Blastococcus sp.]